MRFTTMHNMKPNYKTMLNNTMTIMHMNNNDLVGGMGKQFSSISISTSNCSLVNQQGLKSWFLDPQIPAMNKSKH